MKQTITTPGAWGKGPTSTEVDAKVSDMGFGQYAATSRDDEAKISKEFLNCSAGAVAEDNGSILFFCSVPEPYVGFTFGNGSSLPVEAGYLVFVFSPDARAPTGWRVSTMFPCDRAYYKKQGATVIRK